jgi:hypothetical protein
MDVEARVEVPSDIYAWKADPAMRSKAAQTQDRNRALLQSAFARGLACLGYERDSDGNAWFQLGRWDENWSYAKNS